MYDRVGIANRLFIARKNKNLKQSDVSSLLGINQSSFSALETGKRDMTVPELLFLSDLFSVPIMWLLGVDIITDLTDSERLEIEKYIKYIASLRDK